jgi:hypothetical protein
VSVRGSSRQSYRQIQISIQRQQQTISYCESQLVYAPAAGRPRRRAIRSTGTPTE